ncbi:hypothetical protein JTB14_029694 [Gonioctena quinquepunctata]|nr:hypothetical protein JTB14_029694 [Gonioctena quinquepunctata]
MNISKVPLRPGAAVSILLKNILQVQKENIEVEKQRLEVEKQRLEVEKQRLEVDKQTLEFHRLVGTQLLKLLPMFGNLMQIPPDHNNDKEKHSEIEEILKKNVRKRPCPDNGEDIMKDSKILRNVVEA